MFEIKDLSGSTFGIYKVLSLDHVKYNGANGKHDMSYYKCVCEKCGEILLMPRSQLTQGKNVYHQGCKGMSL